MGGRATGPMGLYVLTIILFHNFRHCQRTINMTTCDDGASASSYAAIFPRRICPLLRMRRRRTMTDMEDNVLPPSVAMRMPLLRHSLLVLLLWHLFLICVTTAFLSLCCVSCSGTPLWWWCVLARMARNILISHTSPGTVSFRIVLFSPLWRNTFLCSCTNFSYRHQWPTMHGTPDEILW